MILRSLYNTAMLFCSYSGRMATILLCWSVAQMTSADDQGWPLYGRDYANQRFSPLAAINQTTIKQLRLEWKYKTGIKATFQVSPIVIGGIMYITTPYNHVIALDAVSGEELWRYRHELKGEHYCCGPANRGAAVTEDKVFTVTIDARLIALNRADGRVLWDTTITDTDTGTAEVLQSVIGLAAFKDAVQTGQTGYSANLAPQVYDGKVYIGVTGAGYGLHLEQEKSGESVLSVGGFSGGGHGLRGFVAAYDVETGAEVWRWYSVADENWHGQWRQNIHGYGLNRNIADEKRRTQRYRDTWKLGGGSVWTTPAIDTELGLLFIGTGNPSPQMDGTTRPGDNLYTVSLVALDIKTGTMRWYYQYVPHDRWGYDVASPALLFEYRENDRVIKAVGHASKLGWFFIHDRNTGELLKRTRPFIRQDNLFAAPTPQGTRIVPGTLGAASWSPTSYDPSSQSVFIAGIYQPSIFTSRILQATPEHPWESYTFFQKANEPDWGTFTALSVTSGKILWQNRVDEPMVGGSLATAGKLVFVGEGNGNFNAFASDNGELLWQYQSEYGVNAPPVSYAVNGRQYITVAAGGNRLFGYPVGDEILTFALKQTP